MNCNTIICVREYKEQFCPLCGWCQDVIDDKWSIYQMKRPQLHFFQPLSIICCYNKQVKTRRTDFTFIRQNKQCYKSLSLHLGSMPLLYKSLSL